jgi:signal transduction histidine kinase
VHRELSIRFRLTAWYALFLVGALSFLGGLIWLTLRQRLVGEVDEDLANRAARFESYVRNESQAIPPAGLKDELEEFCQALSPLDRLELTGPRGFEFHYPAAAPAFVSRSRTLEEQFNVGGDRFHLKVSSSIHAIDHTLDILRLLLLGLIPLVVAIACAGGAWLSRRALKPVDEITSAARAVAIDNLSLRLRTPRTGDELQRLTEVWNTMLGRLEGAVRTLSQFAADASHELRTPLAIIRTSAELALRRARSPEAYRSSLEEISAEAERMTRLVEDLLFLARGDARAAEMPVEPLDLDMLVGGICSELTSLAGTKHIRLRHVSAGDEAAVVSGNPAALRRLLLVLLDNAIKYSHPDSDVIVTTAHDGDLALVTVQDFGIGIGAADQPHIFNRFYQADKARSDAGFGLGLALADSIARAHDAAIAVTSADGFGSTFEVKFKAVPGRVRVSGPSLITPACR